jgi:hypothetical protein
MMQRLGLLPLSGKNKNKKVVFMRPWLEAIFTIMNSHIERWVLAS